MNQRLPAAAGAALMLALSGCSIPNVVEQFNAPVLEMQQATVSNRELQLREKLGQRVSLGPVSFWYTMNEGGWGVPGYSNFDSAHVTARNENDEIAVSIELAVNNEQKYFGVVPYVPEGSPDSAYLEAADAFLSGMSELGTKTVEVDEWELKRCAGGVITTGFYGQRLWAGGELKTSTGYYGLAFTEAGNYIYKAEIIDDAMFTSYLPDITDFTDTLTIE